MRTFFRVLDVLLSLMVIVAALIVVLFIVALAVT